jgi:hypothetical protein
VPRNWLLSILAYGGLMLVPAGAAGLVRPWPLLGGSRGGAAVVVVLGAAVVALLPRLTAPARRALAQTDGSELDRIVPAWHFGERHAVEIAATPLAIDRAVRAVTAGELPLFRAFAWIRSPHLRPQPADILHPPADRPILDVAASTTFVLLADLPGREIVFGTLIGGRRPATPAAFLAAAAPGASKAVMNFRIEAAGSGRCRLVTQTRVAAADDAARRRFDYYWRLIFPGSALIRAEWLGAIKRRAEAGSP